MARVRSVEETERGGIKIEVMSGTGSVTHELPVDTAIELHKALGDALHIHDRARPGGGE